LLKDLLPSHSSFSNWHSGNAKKEGVGSYLIYPNAFDPAPGTHTAFNYSSAIDFNWNYTTPLIAEKFCYRSNSSSRSGSKERRGVLSMDDFSILSEHLSIHE